MELATSKTEGEIASCDTETQESVKASQDNGGRTPKRGVVYLSTIPPYMGPEKVRSLLSEYGEVDRIYLVPEDQTQYKRRVKAGGNKKTRYTEGWVEFIDRKVAKRATSLLSGAKIGGKKRGFYHEDVWLMKYLNKFTWDHLTEKIAYDNRVKQQKQQLEVSQAKRETQFYLEQVEKGKKIMKIEERKKRKLQQQPGVGTAHRNTVLESDQDASIDKETQLTNIRRKFRQKLPPADEAQADDKVLGKLFGKKRRGGYEPSKKSS